MRRAAILFLVGCCIGLLSAIEAVPGATAADWLADPAEASKRAGATAKELEGLSAGTWAAIVTGALGVLAVAKRFAPLISRLIPVWGPMIEGAANVLWAVTATTNQKEADRAAEITHRAADQLAPILLAVRHLPPGTLPDHVQQMLGAPIVRAAIDLLVAESRAARPVNATPVPPA